jgi:HSP20 family protein
MSNQLAKLRATGLVDRATDWTSLRDLLSFDPLQTARAAYAVDYDVTRTESGYIVEVPVPGYGPSSIDVSFKDGVLNISGKTDRRSFTRAFTIPEDVDSDAIEARVLDGMLTIGLHRRPEAQPRKIQVS